MELQLGVETGLPLEHLDRLHAKLLRETEDDLVDPRRRERLAHVRIAEDEDQEIRVGVELFALHLVRPLRPSDDVGDRFEVSPILPEEMLPEPLDGPLDVHFVEMAVATLPGVIVIVEEGGDEEVPHLARVELAEREVEEARQEAVEEYVTDVPEIVVRVVEMVPRVEDNLEVVRQVTFVELQVIPHNGRQAATHGTHSRIHATPCRCRVQNR